MRSYLDNPKYSIVLNQTNEIALTTLHEKCNSDKGGGSIGLAPQGDSLITTLSQTFQSKQKCKQVYVDLSLLREEEIALMILNYLKAEDIYKFI